MGDVSDLIRLSGTYQTEAAPLRFSAENVSGAFLLLRGTYKLSSYQINHRTYDGFLSLSGSS